MDVDHLPTSALPRAEVKGDFGGLLMRQSPKVRGEVISPVCLTDLFRRDVRSPASGGRVRA
jgi:hypothetical protein